jgi:BolA protein
MEAAIRTCITEKFSPLHLAIENESYKHSVPRGSESHFKLLVVSAAFEGKSLVQRHRAVNEAVSEIGGGVLPVHALSITAKTPAQWSPGEGMHTTPLCKGGAGK